MKYLKRFNENLKNYSSYEDVQSILEEIVYLLEVSFNYNVDIKYRFTDNICILQINPINWNLQQDLDKKELLNQDLIKIEKMVQPYLNKDGLMKSYPNGNILRLFISFNLFCQKCKNIDPVCSSCDGNKTILCSCENGMEDCGECFGAGIDDEDSCYSCHGSGQLECDWCSGYGKTECTSCNGTGIENCQHQWL